MFGSYRLLLAILVAMSHTTWPPYAFNMGAWAVVNFYLLSGFVMAALIRRHYDGLDRRLPLFYADRLMRIAPQYLFFVLLTLAAHSLLSFRSLFLERPIEAGGVVNNLLLLPLNFFMFDDAILHFTLIPPSWSLAAELQFYALIPFLLASTWLLRPALLLSLGIFAGAILGAWNAEWFAYRLLPGVLFMFLTGALIFEARRDPRWRRWAVGIFATVAVVALAAAGTGRLGVALNAEVLSGYLMGVPILYALSLRQPAPLDDRIGNGSYGTFLCHFLVFWTLQHYGVFDGRGGLFQACAIGLSVVLGFVGYALVERPVVRLRRRFRARRVA